jgi:hypothetical protein
MARRIVSALLHFLVFGSELADVAITTKFYALFINGTKDSA